MILNNDILFGAVLEQLAQGNRVSLTGTGTSMEPTIQASTDKLVLQSPGPLQLGQICLYRRPGGGYAIHRIHKLTTDAVVLVGDNQVKTETVKPGDILAQVVAIERGTSTIDATAAEFLTVGYRSNKKRLGRFHRRQMRYNIVNFPRRVLKKLLKK